MEDSSNNNIYEETLFKPDFPHVWSDPYIYFNKSLRLWIELETFTFVLDQFDELTNSWIELKRR